MDLDNSDAFSVSQAYFLVCRTFGCRKDNHWPKDLQKPFQESANTVFLDKDILGWVCENSALFVQDFIKIN